MELESPSLLCPGSQLSGQCAFRHTSGSEICVSQGAEKQVSRKHGRFSAKEMACVVVGGGKSESGAGHRWWGRGTLGTAQGLVYRGCLPRLGGLSSSFLDFQQVVSGPPRLPRMIFLTRSYIPYTESHKLGDLDHIYIRSDT